MIEVVCRIVGLSQQMIGVGFIVSTYDRPS